MGKTVVVARKVFRTGVQTLEHDPAQGRWFVTIRNRTYASSAEIPADKAKLWKRLLS